MSTKWKATITFLSLIAVGAYEFWLFGALFLTPTQMREQTIIWIHNSMAHSAGVVIALVVLVGLVAIWFPRWLFPWIHFSNSPLRARDVVKLMSEIPDLKARRQELVEQADKLLEHLNRNGILTYAQLATFVRADDCLAILRRLYHEQLKRPLGHNLDPLAVADYGAKLFTSNRSHAAVEDTAKALAWHYQKGAR